jgi:hypothetical protein
VRVIHLAEQVAEQPHGELVWILGTFGVLHRGLHDVEDCRIRSKQGTLETFVMPGVSMASLPRRNTT